MEKAMAEVLVVASKVKAFIKEKSGMNTSATVMEALSKSVERECERAIESAKRDKRKTVMDRDFASR
jgi:histone H3/H4